MIDFKGSLPQAQTSPPSSTQFSTVSPFATTTSGRRRALRRLGLTVGLVALLLTLLVAGPVAAETHVQLILDASGSMYNKLDDGRFRITAAKDVLSEFVDGLPPGDLHVGLRIYGARFAADQPGACQDSELVVPMDGVDHEALRGAIQSTRARGKTPIAYSLEQALGDFPAGSDQCLIVLVTDGKEVCGDLAAAAAKVEAHGCSIDLRILGFDLDPEAAKSFEGIGTFENAADAAALAQALERAVEETVERAPLGEATLEAADQVTAGTTFEVRWTGPDEHRDYVTIVAQDAPDGRYGHYAYTTDGSPLTLWAPVEPGAYELRYQSDRVDGVAGRRAIEVVAAEFAIGGPESVPAGRPFEIPWVGPDGDRDYLTIVPADAPDGRYTNYAYTAEGSPAKLHAPIQPGDYEIRYQSDRESGVFARRTITVTPVEITLDAPAEVDAGQSFEVAWSGPDGDRDYVTLVPASEADGRYAKYVYTRDGSPMSFAAPLVAGNYELRYQSDRESGVFARVPIVVNAVAITLDAADEVAAGQPFEVSWTGPDGPGDYVTIVEKGAKAGTYKSYAYTRDGPTLRLTAPAEPGDYELRYQSDNQRGVVFGSRAIRVR